MAPPTPLHLQHSSTSDFSMGINSCPPTSNSHGLRSVIGSISSERAPSSQSVTPTPRPHLDSYLSNPSEFGTPTGQQSQQQGVVQKPLKSSTGLEFDPSEIRLMASELAACRERRELPYTTSPLTDPHLIIEEWGILQVLRLTRGDPTKKPSEKYERLRAEIAKLFAERDTNRSDSAAQEVARQRIDFFLRTAVKENAELEETMKSIRSLKKAEQPEDLMLGDKWMADELKLHEKQEDIRAALAYRRSNNAMNGNSPRQRDVSTSSQKRSPLDYMFTSSGHSNTGNNYRSPRIPAFGLVSAPDSVKETLLSAGPTFGPEMTKAPGAFAPSVGRPGSPFPGSIRGSPISGTHGRRGGSVANIMGGSSMSSFGTMPPMPGSFPMGPMGQMNPMTQMGQMGHMGQMGNMGQMGQMGQMPMFGMPPHMPPPPPLGPGYGGSPLDPQMVGIIRETVQDAVRQAVAQAVPDVINRSVTPVLQNLSNSVQNWAMRANGSTMTSSSNQDLHARYGSTSRNSNRPTMHQVENNFSDMNIGHDKNFSRVMEEDRRRWNSRSPDVSSSREDRYQQMLGSGSYNKPDWMRGGEDQNM